MKILFICKGNWFRSQIAESIYNKLTGTKDADSVGSYVGAVDEPEGQALKNLFQTNDFFELMDLHGFDMREKITKRLTPEMLNRYDVIVSMVEEPYIPNYLKDKKEVIWWEVPNSSAVNHEAAKSTYDQIENLVKKLIENTYAN